MLDEREQRALDQIKAYLDAGHTLEEIRKTGWGNWIDRLESKGYDVQTGKLALRPPGTEPEPPVKAQVPSEQTADVRVSTAGDSKPLEEEMERRSHYGWQLISHTDIEARMLKQKRFSFGYAFLGALLFGVGLIVYLHWYLSERKEVVHLRLVDGRVNALSEGSPFELLEKPVQAWWAWSRGQQTNLGKAAGFGIPALAMVLLMYGAAVLITSLSSGSDSAQPSPGSGISSDEVLEQSAVVFEGGYSKGEIKVVLDRAMTLYGLELTDRNYDRATNVLVAMRREFGVREMDILDTMIRSHVPGLNLTFQGAAGIATTLLAFGEE